MATIREEEAFVRRRPSVIVTHTGRQYVEQAVRAAQDAGLLQAFATGVFFGGNGLPSRAARYAAARKPVWLLRSVYGRTYGEVDVDRVTTFPLYPIAGRLARPFPGGPDLERRLCARWGRIAGDWLEALPNAPRVVHAFEGQALEIFEAARRAGAVTILDVNNAHEFAAAELAREGIERPSPGHTRRTLAERELADYLLVPSDFVLECLLANGIPEKRIVKIPLGTAVADAAPAHRPPRERVRVLFVGHVGARKGVKYLLEAWRRMQLSTAELMIVGGTDAVGRELLRDRPPGVTHVGYVSWRLLQRWFTESDIFVFPSLAEGSALVNYQAMATGLPVVTTPNAGSVVRDGVDGFLVPARDVDALADRLWLLCEDADLRFTLGKNAAASIAGKYTWGHYRQRVGALYESLVAAT